MKKILSQSTLIATILYSIPSAALTIGDAAENLMGPTEVITKFVLFACYVVGIALCLAAIAQYKIHRQSPKLVPLTTPILLVLIGIILIFIPIISNKVGQTGSAVEQAKKEGKYEQSGFDFDFDEANQQRRGLSDLPPDESGPYDDGGYDGGSSEPPPPPPPRRGGSHWSQDPKYR